MDSMSAPRNWMGARVDKLLSLVAGTLILAAICVIAKTPPASGYELSMYEAFPLYFWVFIVGSIACGVGILLHQAFGSKRSRWWIAGLLIVMVTNSIILLLPVFRGYAVYGRHDTLTHLGLIRDIITTGHIEENWYPIEHLLGGSIAQIGGLSIDSTLYTLFILVSGVYLLNLYLLAHAATNNHRQALVILVFGAPLIYAVFHVNIHPMLLSLFMVIVVLYCCHRRTQITLGNALPFALIMLVGAFAVVYAHPVTCLFAMVAFFGVGLMSLVYSKRFAPGKPLVVQSPGLMGVAWRMSIIVLAAFFIWYFSFALMEQRVETAYDWLTRQEGASLAEQQMAAAETSQVSFGDTALIGLNIWGAILLLLLISASVAAVVMVRALRRKGPPEEVVFIYAGLFVVACAVSLAELFGAWGENADVVRVTRFAILMGTILTGLATFRMIHQFKARQVLRKLSIAAVFLIIIAMAGMSLGTVYASPRILRLNPQLTHAEETGFAWFEESKDPRIAVIGRTPRSVSRLQDYLFGVSSAPETLSRWLSDEVIAAGLGYGLYDHFSENIVFQRMPLRIDGRDIEHRYVMLRRFDQMYSLAKPPSARSNLITFTEPDRATLKSDPSVARVYYNSEFEVWLATCDGSRA